MIAKYFSVKIDGETKKLVAFDEKQAIERACKMYKCTVDKITRVKELKERYKTKQP